MYASVPIRSPVNCRRSLLASQSPLPIQGSGTFNAHQTSTETNGGCSTVLTTGTFNGAFRARFAGWGARTLRLSPADDARYREDL
jgi:hypothetical protein